MVESQREGHDKITLWMRSHVSKPVWSVGICNYLCSLCVVTSEGARVEAADLG